MAEETPFLWAGKVYADPEADISDHIRRQFGDVPFQYPDVASCLDDPSAPDNLMQADLKWDELPDFAALNVCFFRLFSALGSLERSSVWLSRQGWTVDPAREEPHLAHLYAVPRSGFRSCTARWSVRGDGAPYGPSTQREWLARAVAQITLISSWSASKGLVAVVVQESPGGWVQWEA